MNLQGYLPFAISAADAGTKHRSAFSFVFMLWTFRPDDNSSNSGRRWAATAVARSVVLTMPQPPAPDYETVSAHAEICWVGIQPKQFCVRAVSGITRNPFYTAEYEYSHTDSVAAGDTLLRPRIQFQTSLPSITANFGGVWSLFARQPTSRSPPPSGARVSTPAAGLTCNVASHAQGRN